MVNDRDTQEQQKRSVLGLDDFAHRKGENRALKSFRDRQATEQKATARQARDYRKALKREGYDANQSTRKRNGERHAGGSSKPATKRQKGAFYTADKQKELRTKKQEERNAMAEDRTKEKQQALRKRTKRHRLLSARTPKGQPIMKHIVGDILSKLEKETTSR